MDVRARRGFLLALALLCVIAGCGVDEGSSQDAGHAGHSPVAAHQDADAVIGHILGDRRSFDSGFNSARAIEHPAREPGDPFDLGNPSFCGEAPLVRDFGLSRLPRVQEPPKTGDLPFGPRTVSLESIWVDPILPLGESYGYRLGIENYGEQTPLHWTLSARMMRVDEAGRPVREVDRKTVRVRTISDGEERRVYLTPSRRPGFYRYDLKITSRGGAELAHYEKYVRVIPISWRVRLGLAKRRVRPGQRVLSRVENLGSATASYGENFGVQRQVGGRWIKPPKLSIGTWLAWLGAVGAGAAGRCSVLGLPADLPDGRYRIIKWVHRTPEGRLSGRWVRLVAPFEVVGHASLHRRVRARVHRNVWTELPPLPTG